jgi:hypothetical protein
MTVRLGVAKPLLLALDPDIIHTRKLEPILAHSMVSDTGRRPGFIDISAHTRTRWEPRAVVGRVEMKHTLMQDDRTVDDWPAFDAQTHPRLEAILHAIGGDGRVDGRRTLLEPTSAQGREVQANTSIRQRHECRVKREPHAFR